MLIKSIEDMQIFAEKIGRQLRGGELLELIGDVGAGKTTFVRGLAIGMGVNEQVQSPSFTINRVYEVGNGMRLVHYDFYRLNDPGIMTDELLESLGDDKTVVVIEWADAVSDVLPDDRLTLRITSTGEMTRELQLSATGKRAKEIKEGLQ